MKKIAIISLGCFISGLILPFLITIFVNDSIAFYSGVLLEFFAVILGLIAWRYFLAKITILGVFLLCVLASINYMFFEGVKNKSRLEVEAVKKSVEK